MKKCPKCGFENPDEMKFCGECGEKLMDSVLKPSLPQDGVIINAPDNVASSTSINLNKKTYIIIILSIIILIMMAIGGAIITHSKSKNNDYSETLKNQIVEMVAPKDTYDEKKCTTDNYKATQIGNDRVKIITVADTKHDFNKKKSLSMLYAVHSANSTNSNNSEHASLFQSSIMLAISNFTSKDVEIKDYNELMQILSEEIKNQDDHHCLYEQNGIVFDYYNNDYIKVIKIYKKDVSPEDIVNEIESNSDMKLFSYEYFESFFTGSKPKSTSTPKFTPAPTLNTQAAADTFKSAREKIVKENYGYVDFTELARNPNSYKGKSLTYEGKIVQTMEDNSLDGLTYYNIRLAVGGNYNSIVYVTYFTGSNDPRLLEDDYVQVYGKSEGLYTYESTIGKSVTIPKISADLIE